MPFSVATIFLSCSVALAVTFEAHLKRTTGTMSHKQVKDIGPWLWSDPPGGPSAWVRRRLVRHICRTVREEIRTGERFLRRSFCWKTYWHKAARSRRVVSINCATTGSSQHSS
uniref:Putative secreted peptide n=1 Tax=Anopheles braziliensis TaxID=58242 RepID=A0A2M3ZWB8_9DIPT